LLFMIKEAGEIPLKSARTRPRFEKKLLAAIRAALERHGMSGDVRISQGIIYVEAPEQARDVLNKVFGVHSVCAAIPHRFSDLSDIAEKAVELFAESVKGKKFAVRVKRAGKHAFTSMDVAKVVGAALYPYSGGVDLRDPEVVVRIEVRGDTAYYITDCVRGPGGLPVGTGGRALALHSGGFDSTASSWLAAKRGIEVDFLHLYMGSVENSVRASRIAAYLGREWFAPYYPRMIVADATPVTAWIRLFVRPDMRQVVLRVAMHEIAQLVATRHGYDAVVTGEAIGQASSQTLQNLKVVETLVKRRYAIVLRPVSCFDKEEVVEVVRSIGLYDEVEKVREVCRIAEGPQATRAKASQVAEELSKVPDRVIKGVAEGAVVIDPQDEDGVRKALKAFDEEITIDEIPPGAVLVDARARRDYLEWHVPGAIHIEDLVGGERPKAPLVVYCWHGTLSRGIAKALRALGMEAYALTTPVTELRLRHELGGSR